MNLLGQNWLLSKFWFLNDNKPTKSVLKCVYFKPLSQPKCMEREYCKYNYKRDNHLQPTWEKF